MISEHHNRDKINKDIRRRNQVTQPPGTAKTQNLMRFFVCYFPRLTPILVLPVPVHCLSTFSGQDDPGINIVNKGMFLDQRNNLRPR